MKRYYMEFGGGLGDVIYQVHQNGIYNLFNALRPGEKAVVVLASHNPGARELFTQHPKADQIELHDLGYWGPEEDKEMRVKHGLAEMQKGCETVAGKSFPLPVKFYLNGDPDFAALARVGSGPCVVFAATAGLPERDIPAPILEVLVNQCVSLGLQPVAVGRNYERHGRRERTFESPNTQAVINLIDELSVPATLELVRNAAAVVTCHSAVCIASWLMKRPTLLVYPPSVGHRHRLQFGGRVDQWNFGAHWRGNLSASTEGFSVSAARAWLQAGRAEPCTPSNVTLHPNN